ncbi:serine hydrolase domain-containing protein [Oceaniglobus trochenteri]|uniref:serine hydrolase domain-containing protein n=1 Tax=Oceaniglobus trochenteri TaxID=2763260 RepID=UPI001CFFF8AA|nr:serine hydrolase [Oceaniglobus trochenteri]
MSQTTADTPQADDPVPRREVTLANWRRQPYSGWAFSHLREIAPTAAINPQRGRETLPDMGGVLSEPMAFGNDSRTIGAVLGLLSTDVLLACRNGQPTLGWVAPHADANAPHLLFSVSKSITGLVAGALAQDGRLDPSAPVVHYLPECAGSAFEDATVRNLLDMRVSMNVDETYGNDLDWGARYRRAVLWDPAQPGEKIDLLSLLFDLRKGDEGHGQAFRYRSANTDVLGAVISAAAGKAFHDVAAETLWAPMQARGEAHIGVDGIGTALTAGGISCTAFDLARIGELLRCGGAVGGKQVLSPDLVEDTLHGGDAEAWNTGDWGKTMPGHRYRNQWYARGDSDGCFFAKGIHGQWLYVNPRRQVTIVKLSSQDVAKEETTNALTLALLDAIAERL